MAEGSQSGNSGQINEAYIQDAVETIEKLVAEYNEIQNRVEKTDAKAKEHWVGKGRNAYESQYMSLVRRIYDFGDTMKEIYDQLVYALAEYQKTDTSLSREFTKARE